MTELHKQVEQGFAVLQTLNKKDEDELVAEDPNVTLIFTLWDAMNATSPYPEIIPVRHSLYEDSTLRTVLITKDPADEWKEKIRDLEMPFQVKTYTVTKFGKRFNQTYDVRNLLKETRILLADSRLGHVLNEKLSQEFYKKKRTPILVDLTGDDLTKPILHALECSPVIYPKGNKFAAPVGKISWEAANIADNACDIINAVFEKIGKDKVATIHIRTPESTTIPVYTADISDVFEEK